MANARRFRLLAKVFSSLPSPSIRKKAEGWGRKRQERRKRERRRRRRRENNQPPYNSASHHAPLPSSSIPYTSPLLLPLCFPLSRYQVRSCYAHPQKNSRPLFPPLFPFIPRGKIDLSAAKVVSSFPMRKRNESGASFSVRRMINTFRFSFVLHFWLLRIKKGMFYST